MRYQFIGEHPEVFADLSHGENATVQPAKGEQREVPVPGSTVRLFPGDCVMTDLELVHRRLVEKPETAAEARAREKAEAEAIAAAEAEAAEREAEAERVQAERAALVAEFVGVDLVRLNAEGRTQLGDSPMTAIVTDIHQDDEPGHIGPSATVRWESGQTSTVSLSLLEAVTDDPDTTPDPDAAGSGDDDETKEAGA